MGRVQFVALKDQATVKWAQWATQHVGDLEYLWPWSRSALVNVMEKGLRLCGAEHLLFTLGCLRPRGTTNYFAEGMDRHTLKHL
eukprot:6306361-Karenia_brevis.AAC.1